MTAIYVIGFILALAGIGVLGRAYLKFRGTRLVTCPETKNTAAVQVAAGQAAIRSALGDTHLRLKECNRWPEHRNCGQECLAQIEAAPEDCLVRNVLTRWYDGKACVYCGKTLGEIRWAEHKPALMSPEGVTVEWYELRPETIPAVLANHKPICWNCHIAQKFRREHPDLVVDR